MPGLFFYWTAWTAWVVITFFMKKGKPRTEMAIMLLLILTFSGYDMRIGAIEVNISLIILLFYGYKKLSMFKRRQLWYSIFVCQVVTLAYIGFQLYSLYDPAILWLDRQWMTTAVVLVLVHMLAGSFLLRCIVTVIGAVHGNFLYAWFMSTLSFPVSAGDPVFFDSLAACLSGIVLWRGYEEATRLLNRYFKRVGRQRESDIK